jgi:hypothetical protein
MTVPQGRASVVTPRDLEICEDVFWSRYVTTRQIARKYYNSTARARTRLNQLKIKGYLRSRLIYTMAPIQTHPGVRETVWHLSKAAFDMISNSFDRDDTWFPKDLSAERTRHYVQTNDVYFAAKENLDTNLGPYPEWEWEHEGRAFDSWELAGEPRVHQPDAHVLFRDNLFIIERQTKESNITQKKIEAKVDGHKQYVTKLLEMDPDDVQILFACDAQGVADAAKRAGNKHGIHVATGDAEHIGLHLYQNALRLS